VIAATMPQRGQWALVRGHPVGEPRAEAALMDEGHLRRRPVPFRHIRGGVGRAVHPAKGIWGSVARGVAAEHRELQTCAARRSVAHDETGLDRT
jgi:hypothetical protein